MTLKAASASADLTGRLVQYMLTLMDGKALNGKGIEESALFIPTVFHPALNFGLFLFLYTVFRIAFY